MENEQPTFRQFNYFGDGTELFKIKIINWLLTIITLGFYYPWARAAVLKYNYQKTEFENSSFVFHGTGKEMFKGFIKVVGVLLVIYGGTFAAQLSGNITAVIVMQLFTLVVIVLLIPLAIHGSVRYRTSRSSWRGIHFGYRGNLKELFQMYLGGAAITLITAGLYTSWFITDLRKYVIGNIRFGNITFSYTGKGWDFFVLNFKGRFLTIITLGIYSFWYTMELFEYLVENIYAEQDGESLPIRFSAKGGDYFVLSIVNGLILFFSLGLAQPWVQVRTLQFFMANIWVQGNFNANTLHQTEQDYKDATGEDFVDAFDIDLA
jgi:uncharacterized membrane protein YjgN (DUF898 family)